MRSKKNLYVIQDWREFELRALRWANNVVLYLPSEVFTALMLVGPRKCLKQVTKIKLDKVQNPTWPGAKHLAIYKRRRGFEIRATENKSS